MDLTKTPQTPHFSREAFVRTIPFCQNFILGTRKELAAAQSLQPVPLAGKEDLTSSCPEPPSSNTPNKQPIQKN
jgi:hypothetical protein